VNEHRYALSGIGERLSQRLGFDVHLAPIGSD
jgi:hypothetical protein